MLGQVPLSRDVKPSYIRRADRIEDRLRLSVTIELKKCDKSNAWFYAVTAFASIWSPPIPMAANRLFHAVVSRALLIQVVGATTALLLRRAAVGTKNVADDNERKVN